MIGVIVSKQMATLRDIEEYYGMEDILNMVEIITIDSFNEYLAQKSNG